MGHLLARCGWPGASADRPAGRPTSIHCGRGQSGIGIAGIRPRTA
ncbi:hypothetical protein PCLA_08r0229 [Pseudomonas citronellolis]|nr:hypothetical protein PCLA_08r0229 [Pseudomonas citronellolis]